MISTSTAWKNHANESNVFDVRATMTGGSTVNLTNEDFMLGSVSFTDSISSMSEIKFGSVVTNTFNATLVNTNGRFDNWVWNKISVEFGYNGEWISRGVYNIDRPETIGNTVKIECYDDMDRLNQYFKGFITQTFPVTYKALIQAICTACGVTFGTWDSEIPNSNVTALVASAFNESTTCRQVVSWILEVCGAYARINPVTNRLDCKVWNGTGSYALNGVKEQTVYIDDVTVTGVRAYTYNTNDEYDYATAGTDGYVVYIKDNPFVSALNKADIAAQALTNGGGGSVRPFNATIFGDPSMEAGDIITLTDRRDNTYTSIITSINYTLCGSMRVSCEAKTPQDNSLDYSNPYDSAVWASISYTDNAVEELSTDLQSQIDAKIETWYQATDPSTAWTTTALKNAHIGDIWHNSSTNKSYRWGGTAWQEVDGVPQSLLDTVDGKTTIHYGTKSSVTTADDGDYLVDKTNGMTYQWTNNAWVQQIASPVVNLMPTTYQYEVTKGTSPWTNNGITYTVNKDGSVTVSGTSSSTTEYLLTEYNLDSTVPAITIDPNQRYILHGCPSGGGSGTYRLIARYTPTGTTPSASTGSQVSDYGSGVSIPANSKYVSIRIYISSGQTINVTFYPMLEAGTVKHGFVSNRTNMASYTTSQIDGIKVGGRNLLNNTASMTTVGDTGKIFRASGGAVSNVSLSSPPINGLSRAIRVTNGGSSATNIGLCQDRLKGFVTGHQYTESCWVRASQSLQVYLQPLWLASSQNAGNNANTPFTIGTDWTYIKWTGTLAGTQAEQYSAGYVYAKSVPQNGWIEVCGLKLEEGNKATDWTPSPEDVESMAVTNLMPSIYYSEYDSTASVYSHNGITYTIGKDGSVTASGTPSGTSNSQFNLSGNTLTSQIPVVTLDPNNTYILHGCPSGGSSTTYKIQARCHKSNETPNGSGGTLVEDVGDGVLLPVGTKYAYIYTYIYNATGQVTNLKFYPMLETGSVKHPYVSSRSNATSYAESKVTALDNSFNQTKVFNRLTNNGANQGLYLDSSTSKIYLNAEYIRAGTIESAIIARNLTMTGGSVNISTSDQTLDIIKFNYNDSSSTWKDSIDIRTNYLEMLTIQGTVSPSTTWKQCGVVMSADHNAGGGATRFAVTNDDSTNGTLEVLGAVAYAGGGGFVTIMGEELKDFVIEEGTWNTSGWYRKWYSGKAECHAYFSFTTAVSTSYGSGKAYYVSKSISFPSNLFVAGPVINLTIERSSGLMYPSISSSSKTKVDFFIASPVSESSTTVWVHATAFGKWKS